MATSGRFVIRMDPGLHAALREAAHAAGTSLNDFCVRKLAQPGQAGAEAAGDVVRRAGAIAGESLVGVAVFGSWARGQEMGTSDVDVLVVVDTGVPITRDLYRWWDEAPLRWDSRRVEAHFVRLPAVDARMTGFWAEVAVDGIVLFERGFELSRHLVGLRSRIAVGEMVRRWSRGHPYWTAA